MIVCQMTSDIAEAPDFRITIEPTENNGLRTRLQVIADKPVTIRRERVGRKIRSLDGKDIDRLNAPSTRPQVSNRVTQATAAQ